MLKFLQNRQQDKSPRKSPIKYLPQMCYGNSFQSPQEFQTPKTIFYRSSYINPYLKYEKRRQQKIPHESIDKIEPSWTKKSNLTNIQQHKILKNKGDVDFNHQKSRYLSSYNKQFFQNPARFRMTRGQFTDYIEKNNHYKSIGPLQGIQRTQNRIQQTKKSVWIKPSSKRQQMTSSLIYASSLNTTIKSNISKNSQLLIQKNRIRKNRQRIQHIFRKSLEHRNKNNTTYNFQLTKDGPGHQLYLLDHSKKRQTRKKTADGMQQLQQFQYKLPQKFK